MTYEYFINLDERGSFYADVRTPQGRTVFEVKAGNELAGDETSIFEDSYMEHKTDMTGLQNYLQDMKIIGANDTVEIAN